MKPKHRKDIQFRKYLKDADVIPVTEERERRKLRKEAKQLRSRYDRRTTKIELDKITKDL